MTILGFIAGFYLLARKFIENEPLKTHLSNSFECINKNLSLYKDQKPKLVLDILLKLSNKFIFYTFLLILRACLNFIQ